MDEERKPDTGGKEQHRVSTNPGRALTFRLLTSGIVLYWLYEIVAAFVKGGAEAPSVGELLLAIALLGGGAIVVAVVALRIYKRETAPDQDEAGPEQLPEDTDHTDA